MHHDQLIAVLDRSADAAFALTRYGKVWAWNAAAEALFECSRAEALHQPFAASVEPRGSSGRVLDEAYCTRAVADGRVASFDMSVGTRKGRQLWVNVSVLVFDALLTRPPVIVHLVRDITPAKRREALARRLAETARRLVALRDEAPQLTPITPLSEQEQWVLRLFAEGKRPSEVAHELSISVQTLRNHLHHINQKLGTHNRLEAVMHAIRSRLVEVRVASSNGVPVP